MLLTTKKGISVFIIIVFTWFWSLAVLISLKRFSEPLNIFLEGFRVGRIGGKDSTKYVVKGTYKPVPPELISELKAMCQVICLIIRL